LILPLVPYTAAAHQKRFTLHSGVSRKALKAIYG